MTSFIFKANDDWTFDTIHAIWDEIAIIGTEELKIPFYTPQIEVVTAEQMLDAYSSVGMPLYYKHWSFGKQFSAQEKHYKQGQMYLAYEMVINSNPCIAYLMEENNMCMQAMVLAHASVGHSAVFKNNYMFKEHTNADSIINYLMFARNYIKKCEERYGEIVVEELLDACHSISYYSIDRHTRRNKQLHVRDEERIALEKFEQELADYNPLWEKLIKKVKKEETAREEIRLPKEPEQNLLYFIEKHAPMLPAWKREIIRIVRKIAQYFYPQMATKVLNEGYASFCHYYIMTRLHEKGLIDEGTFMEFLIFHTGVITQPDWYEKHFNGINPYALGFAIFMDIKRMCEAPTSEDQLYFPDLAGKDWVAEVNYAMANFKDSTFIMQYLSPKVMRDFKFFHLADDYDSDYMDVVNIQDERGFRAVRERLANQYDISFTLPMIRVTDVDIAGDRTMTLKHEPQNGVPLDEDAAMATVLAISSLWEFDVQLYTIVYPDETDDDFDGGPMRARIRATGKYSTKADGEVGVEIELFNKPVSTVDMDPTKLIDALIRKGKITIP